MRQVLLVDDNPTNLQVLYQALEAQGYELLIAQSGVEALETAAVAKPALILLDINMPGIDGFETCRRLKAAPETSDIVVIFLSARDSHHDKVEGLRLGAVDYVTKPFQFEEVVARVNTQLELRRAREELREMHEKADALLLNILPRSIAERLTTLIRNHLGGAFAPFARSNVHSVGGKDVLVVECLPTKDPVYFRRDGEEIFYVRSGLSTQKLSPSEVVAYVGRRSA